MPPFDLVADSRVAGLARRRVLAHPRYLRETGFYLIIGRMLKCIGLSSQRLLANVALLAAALLLIAAAQSAHSATVEADASSGGSGQDCEVTSSSGFDAFLRIGGGLICNFANFPVQVFRMDFIFDAPPNVADFMNCDGGPLFADCGAFAPSPGVTDFFLFTPSPAVAPGIPANQLILLGFIGFDEFGQEVELVANAPEPPPAFPLALAGILAIISSWRSKRARPRGTHATPAI